ncbi:MAG: sulfatase-like hydrolase/transferase, partial [Armatimonadota bacterium]|nr:sulfatase-like hydrolase/transferase [Armatimonadota bacterium]
REKHPPRLAAPLAYSSIVPERASQTRWVGDRACAYLHSAQLPFFLYVSFVAPHDPYDPPARFLDLVDPARLPRPLPAEWENDPLAPSLFRRVPVAKRFATTGEREWTEIRRHYLASVAFIDEQVGRVLDALEARGIAHDTAVFFTSDHGDMLGDHGLPFKGAWHYDACIRVPLIIAAPGSRPRECAALVENLDLFPTILELAGVKHEVPVEGRSLVPWLGGNEPAHWREDAYSESYATYSDHQPDGWARTVRTAEWRYTLYPSGGGEQLFHLRDDPGEQVNRAGDPGCASVRREMRDRLMERIVTQDWPFPTRGLFRLGTH